MASYPLVAKSEKADVFDAFLSVPYFGSCNGYVIVRSTDLDVVIPTNGSRAIQLATVFSWTADSFLAETGPLATLDNGHLSRSPPYIAVGSINRTNWDYRNNKLVIYGRPGKMYQELLDSSGGRISARVLFDQIMGRGLDLKSFSTITLNDDRRISGSYVTPRGNVPIRGKAWRGEEPLEVFYSYELGGMDIPISYLHQVWLQPFSAGGYVPLRLRSWYVHGQVTNKPSEFEILAAGTNVLYPSLSPFELYAQAREGLLDQDRLYIRKGTNLIEIPRAGTSAEARVVQPASTGRWLATVLFVIISVAFAFLLFRKSA
jgi:hypothetical protein